MSLERAIIRSPKGDQMQLQCLSQRFTYSIERNILERRGPPRGGSSLFKVGRRPVIQGPAFMPRL